MSSSAENSTKTISIMTSRLQIVKDDPYAKDDLSK